MASTNLCICVIWNCSSLAIVNNAKDILDTITLINTLGEVTNHHYGINLKLIPSTLMELPNIE